MRNPDTAPTGLFNAPADPPALLAPPRHTWTLFGIVAVLTILGALNDTHDLTAHQAPDPARMIKTDLFMIGILWFWVVFVYKGMRERGRSIREFFGPAPFTPGRLLADAGYGVLAIALVYAASLGLDHLVPERAGLSNNPILSATPDGLAASLVWICLSLSAGICEEIVFRGYLQRQLATLTGRIGLAILIQAAVFAVGHAYEGTGAVLRIVLHGLVLGVLAHWRGNIRAGIVQHAGWDLLVGFGLL
jgi:membrane protease YdiL (CAAX protease family)